MKERSFFFCFNRNEIEKDEKDSSRIRTNKLGKLLPISKHIKNLIKKIFH